MKCLVCGRTKQGAMVCRPCRQAADRLIRNEFSAEDVFIVMMYPQVCKKLLRDDKK